MIDKESRMVLKERLEKELLEAMRSKDDVRKRTIRLTISTIKLAEVEKGETLDDAAIMNLLYKEIKMRQETIVEAKKENRENIILDAEAEVEILNKFLPKPLSDEEIRNLAINMIHELNATNIKDMGRVMKELVPKVEGRASSDLISRIVRELLSNQ
jgi:uncharacterized protein YqeY